MRVSHVLLLLMIMAGIGGAGWYGYRQIMSNSPPSEPALTAEFPTEYPETEFPEARPDSWLGIALDVRSEDTGGQIREPSTKVIVHRVIPTTPAENILKPDDVIVEVTGIPIATPKDFIEIVRPWPVDLPVDLVIERGGRQMRLSVKTEIRPSNEALLERAFIGKKVPSPATKSSTAHVAPGGVIEDTQCVSEVGKAPDPKTCPGLSYLLDYADRERLFAVWSLHDPDGREQLARLKDLQDRFGLNVMLYTNSSASALPVYFKESRDPRPDRLMVMVAIIPDEAAWPYMRLLNEGSILFVDAENVVRDVTDGWPTSYERFKRRREPTRDAAP